MQAIETSEDGVSPNPELQAVVSWRLSQLLSLGLELPAAETLAESSADLGLMRRLVGQGCPPPLAARIAL